MDIPAVNNNLDVFLSESQRKQKTLENFQSVLEKAQQNQSAGDAKRNEEIREACEEFESYFLQMMFREMRKTSFSEGGLFEKSHAEQIFTDMLDEEVSKQSAKHGGIGIAEMMYKQMTQYNTLTSPI
ncbi:MAG: rod-binding protein [Clostridiales bacterium]|jgi:flagellar protein FlgJ|nr:rod-binding protein [Clostridiales bacterium]